MKYCPYCGTEINPNQDICLNCGKLINNNPQTIEVKTDVGSSGTKIICVIVSLLFPIVGAILYYVFRRDNPSLAKTCNLCAWLAFLPQIILLILLFTILVA